MLQRFIRPSQLSMENIFPTGCEHAPNPKFEKRAFARASITKIADDKSEYTVKITTTDSMHSGTGIAIGPLASKHLRFASEKGSIYYSAWEDLVGKTTQMAIESPIESNDLVVSFLHDRECVGQYIGPYRGVGTFEYESKDPDFTWHR